MAQSYAQIQRQIESLQRQAERLRAQEVDGVVARIKIAISHYGLTAEQLGLGAGGATPTRARSRRGQAPSEARPSKYADALGHEWSGRGRRPQWLLAALSGGKSLDSFANQNIREPSAGTARKPASKRQAKTHYRDENGHSWSGMGPQPRWLKEALSAGASLEQFAVQRS